MGCLDGVDPTYSVENTCQLSFPRCPLDASKLGCNDEPGIGSFPCLFKKAEYAMMNFCACLLPLQTSVYVLHSHSIRYIRCSPTVALHIVQV